MHMKCSAETLAQRKCLMMSARCSPDNHDYFVHEAGWHGRVHSQVLEVSPEGCSGASLA